MPPSRSWSKKIDALIKRIFGKSSEKLTPEEQLHLFEGCEAGKPQASSASDLPDVAQ
jgi:hypothetical protein